MSRRTAFLLAAFALVGLAEAPLAQTSEYATLATISATMGVNGNRLCLGEASRGDIGCPTYAPFVSSGGLVGIGTNTPLGQLHIVDNGTGGRFFFDSASNSGNAIILRTSSINNTALLSNTLIGGLAVRPFNGVEFVSNSTAGILFRTAEDIKTNALGADIVFTATAPSSTINYEIVRFLGAGRVGIGTGSPNASLTIVNGEIQTASSGAACTGPLAGAIRYTGGNLSYCNGSAWTLIAGASGGTPGGVSGSIQFNSGGSFAGRSDFTIDSSGNIYNRANFIAGGSGYSVGSSMLQPGTSTHSGYTGYYMSDNSRVGYVGYGNATGMDVWVDQNAPLNFGTSGTIRMRVAANGNVGIGTLNPGALLTVGAISSSPTITNPGVLRLHPGNNSAYWDLKNNGGVFNLDQVTVGTRLTVNGDGNVGIATVSPNASLEVAGRTSTTVLQLGESNDTCTTGTVGTIRRNPATGRFQICRM